MIAPVLETERLILRGVLLELFEQQYSFMSDPRVMAFIGGGKPRSRQESWQKYCQSAGMWSLLGYGYWAITDRTSGVMIGMGGLGRFERGIEELEGYPEAGWAFSAESWGKGIATEAMQAVFSWADAVLKVNEIRCIIDPENLPSIRVAEKCNFSPICEVENELGRSIVLRRLWQANTS
jgi:RimJ/RimL family protein N-acetyltransferase